jgi:hypothetical protein
MSPQFLPPVSYAFGAFSVKGQAASACERAKQMIKRKPLMNAKPFWKAKSLSQMTRAEWESLCDGCGRCCLNKLEDWDTGEIAWTNIACRLLDGQSCRCTDYDNRQATVPDCIGLTPQQVETITWLPPTCGYRLVAEGADLYWWHPLVSGDPETVHEAGVSVRGRTVSEAGIEVEDFEDYLVDWPGEEP